MGARRAGAAIRAVLGDVDHAHTLDGGVVPAARAVHCRCGLERYDGEDCPGCRDRLDRATIGRLFDRRCGAARTHGPARGGWLR